MPFRRAAATFAARLTFEDVRHRFGEREVLHGVSLDVAPGEIVCLLGPSGCGKTTLLRIASGIERPTGGRVLMNDLEVAGPSRFVPPEKRNVGLMFQEFALFPHLTVLENVAFGLWAIPKPAARAEALAVLARMGLSDHANAYPETLSGGQQQRVALARAIVPRPGVMLMDEPFSGLDVQLRDSMQEETLALLKETRATAMIVTHSPQEALRLGDRVAVLRAGRLVQVGRAEELYRAPKSLFIARLFSEINELPAIVRGGAVATPFGSVPAPGLADGTAAVLCLRRRLVRLVAPGQGLPGRVLSVKFQGDLALLEIGVFGMELPLTTVVREWEEPRAGAEVHVTVDPAGILVFPAEKQLVW